MKIINLSEGNSILNQFICEIRDITVQKDQMRFRRNIERIGEIMAYEISKELDYKEVKITTPNSDALQSVPQDNVVLGTILRAGLPLHTGFHNYFDHAENAFVSAFRKYTSENEFDVIVEYLASPRLDGKTLILVDPMLATGISADLSYRALLTKGKPAKTIFACVIASQQAVDYVISHFPEDTILYCAAIDPILNEHAYIVPGLGDAGDLCFGEKE
ncbi:MAG: uracil phosphoribosyltransferase [Bacteroidaceae bacterium]|jgi:uracil phosphoribosyltransferase|nr:uracil phosphoribosyltransferase [Bacteroidaceae bacterium]